MRSDLARFGMVAALCIGAACLAQENPQRKGTAQFEGATSSANAGRAAGRPGEKAKTMARPAARVGASNAPAGGASGNGSAYGKGAHSWNSAKAPQPGTVAGARAKADRGKGRAGGR